MKKLLVFIALNCAFINICYGDEIGTDFIDGTVYIEEEFLDSDLLKITVKAKEIMTPVIGTSFHLKTDTEKVEFLRYEPGNYLERGGDPFYLVRSKGERIMFGSTLRKEDSFPIGDGDIVSFLYQIKVDEDIPFDFKNGVVSSLDTVRQDLTNIIWENKLANRGESEGLFGISDFYGKDTVVEGGSSSAIQMFWPLVMVFSALGVAVIAVYVLKKLEHKRAYSSVNFKSDNVL